MELDSLEVLIAVAEEKSFSRAAERLHRTQPAVSQTIKRLENEVGETLFDRSSKNGTLTEAGHVLLEYANKMLNLKTSARTALTELRQLNRGRLVISANEHMIFYLLPLICRFREQYPLVKVDVQRGVASDIPQEVLSRDVELGIVSFRPAQRDLKVVKVGSDELVLIVPPGHRFAGSKSVRIADLAVETFVAHNAPSPYREFVIKMFEKHRVKLNIGIEMPSLEGLKRLVEAGSGIALVPKTVVSQEIRSGSLNAISVKEFKKPKELFLVRRKNSKPSHAAQEFIKLAK